MKTAMVGRAHAPGLESQHEVETGDSGNRVLPQLHKEFKDNLVFVRPPYEKIRVQIHLLYQEDKARNGQNRRACLLLHRIGHQPLQQGSIKITESCPTDAAKDVQVDTTVMVVFTFR